MNLELSEEQLALQTTVRRFLSEKAGIATYVRPGLGALGPGPDAVWRGLADVGATGLLVAPECGGSAASMVEAGIVAEELGAALFPGPWLSAAVAVPRALLRFGAEAQAADLLTGIADGSVIAGVAMPGLSPVAGFDNALVVHPGTSSAADDWLLYRTDVDGVPGSPVGSGDSAALRALTDDLVVIAAADALGAAARLLDLTIDYAKTRRQFGQPIGSFQAVQQLCVQMFQSVELARGGVMQALWSADQTGLGAYHLAAARLKAFGPSLAAVGDTAIQVLGGIGYTWEHDAHLYLRRLLAFTRLFGGASGYLEQLGAELVSTSQRSA